MKMLFAFFAMLVFALALAFLSAPAPPTDVGKDPLTEQVDAASAPMAVQVADVVQVQTDLACPDEDDDEVVASLEQCQFATTPTELGIRHVTANEQSINSLPYMVSEPPNSRTGKAINHETS